MNKMYTVYIVQIECKQFFNAFIHTLKKVRKMATVHVEICIWEVKVDSESREIRCNWTCPLSMATGWALFEQAGGEQE